MADNSAMAASDVEPIYRILVQGITDYAIYLLSPEGIVSNWNAGAERAKGYTADEIIGEHFSRFYTPEDRQINLPQRALAKALEEGKFEGEGWRVRKDGSRFWAHVVMDAIYAEDGSLFGFAKITRDMTEQREAQRIVREQERNFKLLVQGVTDYAIYMLTPDGMVSNWNAGAEHFKGYRSEEIVGQHFSKFYTEEDQRKGMPQRALAKALSRGKFEGEGWRLRRDGSRFWAHVIIDPIRGESGELLGFAKITRDLTEPKKQADQAKKVRENLDLALENMSQGLCLFDRDEQLVICNPRFQQILGFAPGEVEPGSTLVDMLWALHADPSAPPQITAAIVDRERAVHLKRMASAGESVTTEMQLRGRSIAVSHRALPGGGWVSTMDDVTERREIERHIAHLAHHDSLTALANRAAFRVQLAETLAAGSRFAILYLDLDRFKPVNDTLGHPIGDAVLQAVARRICAQLRKSDVGARLGGDEFAILLADCETEADAYGVAERIIRDLGRPYRVGEIEVTVGASIGIAFADARTTDADLLLRNADLALYAAKEGGRNCHRSYRAGMEAVLEKRRLLEADLRRALDNNELSLHYQPVVNIERSKVNSFEALIRWHSPTRGYVPPNDFVPFAEELGLMPEIGEWVLRTACLQAREWDAGIKLSVNLSVTQLKTENLVERVQVVLQETGFPADRLELEITETAMITDVKGTTATLKKLRDLGIEIALDDFGTGYSSLSFLRNLPFTRIKIDRSFIQDLGTKPEAAAIVRAVSRLCESLGVSTTSEGVETEEQMAILEAEGCAEIQGYLISRPQPADKVEKWLEDFRLACQGDCSCQEELTASAMNLAVAR